MNNWWLSNYFVTAILTIIQCLFCRIYIPLVQLNDSMHVEQIHHKTKVV